MSASRAEARLPARSQTATALAALALLCGYFVSGWLGLRMPYAGSHITLVWLPTGIAVAGLLRWGRGVWPGIFGGALLVNLSIGSTPALALAIACGNTLGPLLAATWLARSPFRSDFSRREDFALIVGAAGAGMAVSATGGVASLLLAGLLSQAQMTSAWMSWWMGDTVGVLLAAPALLSLQRSHLQEMLRQRGAVLLWCAIALPVAWLAFLQDYPQFGRTLPLAFLTLPLVAWAALRQGVLGAAGASLAFSVAAAWGASRGVGTFYVGDSHVSLFLLWSYMTILMLTGMLITAMQAEQTRAELTLRLSEEKLGSLYQLAPLGIVLSDTDGRIAECNDAFDRLCGCDARRIRSDGLGLLRGGGAFAAGELEALLRDGRFGPLETTFRRSDGSVVPLRMQGMALERGDGQRQVWTIVEDITDRKAAEDEIRYLAFYDPLTRLPNRRLLIDRLRQALAAAARSGRIGALLFIDLDHFKTLNDSLGHDKGDLLLQQVAQRLTACVREADTVARLGGDEFVVMLEGVGQRAAEAATIAEQVGDKLLTALGQVCLLDGREHHGTSSIGITLFGQAEETIDELLKQADLAMYQAKAAGRNALRFFDPRMQAEVSAHVALASDLRLAVRGGHIVPWLQGQVDGNGRFTGAELLARWPHATRGMVPPDRFIPLAEESGLIVPLGQAMLDAACARLAQWDGEPALRALTLSVNVSIQQLRRPDFVTGVLQSLARHGADPRRLKLEITESLLMDNVEDTIAKMSALRAHGVDFALDDFGTGYSSLAYLKRLPLEKLKIDRSFVRDVLTDPNDAAIARTVVALAQSLGLSVIAEGVETPEQQAFLAEHGCHAYQGYLFCRPMPVEEFEALVAASAGAAPGGDVA